MARPLPRVLILDSDADTLITLQRVLENAEIDVTVSWDEMEACRLLETTVYDLMLIGDHPPELDASAIIDRLSLRGTCPSVLILCSVISEMEVEHFRSLGASGVIPKQDSTAVVDRVRNALARIRTRDGAENAGCNQGRSLRVGS